MNITVPDERRELKWKEHTMSHLLQTAQFGSEVRQNLDSLSAAKCYSGLEKVMRSHIPAAKCVCKDRHPSRM
jgi:hypothetical protein